MQGTVDYLTPDEREQLHRAADTIALVKEGLLELDRILGSQIFATAPISRTLLAFTVGKTLLGQADQIKELTIGSYLYSETLAPDDTKVRVAVRDLRKRLAGYYAVEGRNDAIEISIPKGTYVPTIVDRRPSVVFVPFVNWYPEGGQDYLCNAFLEDVAHQLRLQGVCVNDAVGQNGPAGPRYRVNGTFACLDDRLHISTAVGINGTLISCCTFDEERDGILRISRRVAEAILKIIYPS